MEMLSDPLFWTALGQITLINIVLSGDNAVVIALAARSLPVHQQKQAVMWGAGAAVVMRIILTIIAVELDRKSTRLNSSHIPLSRMPSSA